MGNGAALETLDSREYYIDRDGLSAMVQFIRSLAWKLSPPEDERPCRVLSGRFAGFQVGSACWPPSSSSVTFLVPGWQMRCLCGT